MPLVRISLLKGKSPEHLRAVADGVHAALVESFAVPPDDRFQLIEQFEPGSLIYDLDYLGVHRTDDLVMVHVTHSATRDTATKQALYAAIVARLTQDPGLRPEDVFVTLSPNNREDWSFGNGVGQYIASR